MRTRRSISTAFSQAADFDRSWCSSIVSLICAPMLSTGLSDVIGSWKIIEMSLPRTARICASSSLMRSRPSSSIAPETIRPGGSGMSRITESAVMLLPQPDSPTIASVSRGRSVNERSSTALMMPSRVKKYVRSPATSRTGRPARSSGRLAIAASELDRFISTALPRIENVAQRIAQKVRAEYRETDGDAGKDNEPRRRADIFSRRLRQHAAPGRIGLRHAKAKERQRSLGEYGRAELRGCKHDQRRKGIGQDMAHRDARLAHAHGLRRFDEGQLAQGERVRTDHARHIGDERDRYGNDGILQRWAERRRHHQRQHQERQGLQDIHHALDDEIDPAAEVTGGEPEDDAEAASQHRRADADRERNPRAVDDARIDVATKWIGAQPVGAARGRERERGICRQRIVAREDVGEYGGEHEQAHDRRARRAERISPNEIAQPRQAGVRGSPGLDQFGIEIDGAHPALQPLALSSPNI